MKILIVEDEALALSRLKRLLNELGESDIVFAADAKSALELMENSFFELLFLDINLPDTLGTTLAYKALEKNPNAFIVFQTAHEEYALKAFEIGAIGYLLKPYSKEQLQNTLVRASKAISIKTPIFMGKEDGEYMMADAKEIYYVKVELSQTVLRTKERFLYYAKKISDMDELLAPYGFFRIHRSYLVNSLQVKKIVTVEQGRLLFYFDGINESVESSKDGARLFRHHFGDK
jgi:two-component system LytT family response regulator